MFYRVLADIVVLTHFLWIVFLIFGAFLGVRNRAIRIVHISGLVFAVIVELFDWYCPLTYLEVWLKSRSEPVAAYTGSFIVHYLEEIIYIETPRYLVIIAAVMLCAFNSWVYHRKKDR
jgi:hypothetical protein